MLLLLENKTGEEKAKIAKRGKSYMNEAWTWHHLRAKRCSWMRVSWTFASAELVTMRQLMNPSEIASAIAFRSKLCTIIGRASVNSADSPPPDRSVSAASCSAATGAGARRSTSVAQRLIVRSSWEAEFCVCVRARHRRKVEPSCNVRLLREGGGGLFLGLGYMV